MTPAVTAPRDESTGLSSSRAEFASSLSRRLESVLGALSALEQQPESVGRRDNFLRRVHALGASAKVLGFAAAAEIFGRTEQQIRTSQIDTLADDILAVRKCLSDLPALVLRGAYSLAPPGHPISASPSAAPLIAAPLAVVTWSTAELLDMLHSLDKSGSSLEVTNVTDPEMLREACIALGPDVLLLDANQGSITRLVDELAQAPEVSGVAIVVANVPEEAASGLLELGARAVLPALCTSHQLARTLMQARHVPVERAATPSPIGEVTLKDLAERLAQELREGLVDAALPSAQIERIDLGDGTPIRAALWSALAQIREHVIENSAGRVEFVAGPEGSVPMAPRALGSGRRAGRSNVDFVDLSGRRMLVVDDDPAVVWFVGGTLRAAGAVVTEARDGAQALEIACRQWPELIVSDVMMPGLDGFALCHAIKRDVLLRDVPIVLLSWKEDLLFRLRDLGADADGYLRKEASASTIVHRVRELLLARSALEHRLSTDRETRGRLDGTTVRLLLELAAGLDRPVRIALRDASALYDIRLRHGSLATVTRTRHDATVEHGQSVLSALLGITAGRFSVVTDRDPCEPMFSGSLQEVLGPSVLRARAAQRVLSGLRLGLVDSLTLEPDAFGSDLPLLPMSLRPIADELLRGTAPRQLLASGVASVQLLESLLSDVARRGAVRAVADAQGEDLLEQEILALTSTPSIVPPKPATSPPPLFSFQLSPAAPEARDARAHESHAPTSPTPTLAPAATSAVEWQGKPSRDRASDAAWDLASGTLSGVGRDAGVPNAQAALGPAPGALRVAAPLQSTVASGAAAVKSIPVAGPSLPASNAPPVDDVDWAMEFNWDSTPAPAGSDAKSTSEPIESKPVTSGGFMRPAIATLERRFLQVTPDLANAVAQAVSEATPTPAEVPRGSSGRSIGDSPAATAAPAAPAAPAATAAPAAPAAPAQTSPAPNPPQVDANPAPALPLTDELDPAASGTPPLPNQIADVAALAGDPALVPALPDTPAPTPPLPQVLAASPTLNMIGDEVPTGQPEQPRAPTAIGGNVATERAASVENPAILPVIHLPPRPKPEPAPVPPAAKGPEPFQLIDRDSEDPVFPLVSTASVGVEVQPSIDVGTTRTQPAYESLPPSDLTSLDPKPVENRDTLRSPEDSQREVVKPLFEAAVAAAPRPQQQNQPIGASTETPAPESPQRTTSSPDKSARSTSDPPSSASRAPHQRPTSNAPPVGAQPPRPVGWIQALGLAALAGIVTFAATVPIASWIRKRHEPNRTEPPLAAEILASSTTTTTGAGPNASHDAGLAVPSDSPLTATPPSVGSGSAPPNMDATTTNAAPNGAAQVQEVAIPTDVALQPGQALIEVVTGGGHAIFVDDSFVGRGPIRVITVQPGRHLVRTRLNGVERTDPVDVGAGRSLRLSLEQAWK